MNTTKFSKLSDRLALRVTLFLLTFLILTAVFHKILPSLCLSALGIALFEIIRTLLKVDKKKDLSRAQQTHRANCMHALLLQSQNELETYFNALFVKLDFHPTLKRHLLQFTKSEKNFAVYPLFLLNGLSPENIVDLFKRFKLEDSTKLCVLTNTASSDAQTLATKLHITLLLSNTVYTLMRRADHFPTLSSELKPVLTAQGFFQRALEKNRFKGYLTAGFFILLLSFLTPFKLYYQIFSAILLLFALLSIVLHKNKKTLETLPF